MSNISESQLLIPTLKFLNSSPTGFMSTSDLIAALEDHFKPNGADAALLDGRNDTHFSQKVRNLVSHRNSSTGLETRGWANYDGDRAGWTITEAGKAKLALNG